MTPRERTLVVIVLALLLFGGGGAAGSRPIQPLQQKQQAAQNLQKEVDDLDQGPGDEPATPQVEGIKRASLPPNLPPIRDPNRVPTYSFAVAEYKRLMQHLLLRAGITDGRPTSDKVIVNGRASITPEIAPKKPAYATITVNIESTRPTSGRSSTSCMATIEFLDLLHQITTIRIAREGKLTDGLHGLKVSITSEAIALDGVPPRANLIHRSHAGRGGGGNSRLAQAVSARPSMVEQLIHSGAWRPRPATMPTSSATISLRPHAAIRARQDRQRGHEARREAARCEAQAFRRWSERREDRCHRERFASS